jgi:hypothetical protein
LAVTTGAFDKSVAETTVGKSLLDDDQPSGDHRPLSCHKPQHRQLVAHAKVFPDWLLQSYVTPTLGVSWPLMRWLMADQGHVTELQHSLDFLCRLQIPGFSFHPRPDMVFWRMGIARSAVPLIALFLALLQSDPGPPELQIASGSMDRSRPRHREVYHVCATEY